MEALTFHGRRRREIYVKLLNQCVGYLQHFQIPGQIVPVQRRRGIHGTFAVGKHIDVRIQLKVIGQIYGIVKCGVNLFF